MLPSFDAPTPLSNLDANIHSLLVQRDAIFDSLKDPIASTQSLLAKVAAARVSGLTTSADSTATTLADVAAKVADRLDKLNQIARAIEHVRAEENDRTEENELNDRITTENRLAQLARSELSNAQLAEFAAKGYHAIVETDRQIMGQKSEVRKLKSMLSGWWERVIVEWFRKIFDRPTLRDRLDEAETELEQLDKKIEVQAKTAQKEAATAIRQQLREARANIQKKRTKLAAAHSRRSAHFAELRDQQEKCLESLQRNGVKLRASLQAFCDSGRDSLNSNADELDRYFASLPLAAVASWAPQVWIDWPPPGNDGKPRLDPCDSRYLRIGEVRERIKERLQKVAAGDPLQWLNGVKPIRVPVVVPFIGGGKTLVISYDKASRDVALLLVQMLILRIAAMLGRQALFTLLDPAGHGQAFPLQRFLRARTNADDVNADLKAVLQDIRRINQSVLTGEAGLHELDSRRLASESFEVVVAATFPGGYDRRSVETLFNITTAGLRAGRYVILHHDRDQALPREYPIESITNRFNLDPRRLCSPPPFFQFEPDELPDAEQRQDLLERINKAGRIDHSLAWDDLVGLKKTSEWWKQSSQKEIATPIGLRGATDPAEVWFGQRQSSTCAHGMLAGMSGAGKSTLYHGLILGLAVRYSPAELQMYLIDGKFGVEFEVYKNLPHAKVVSLKSAPELSRSTLLDVFREMERRNASFVAAGVDNISSYRNNRDQTDKTKELPRLLLVIDEYQELFEDDSGGQASDLLLRLAQQGRSAGIHMILGSQKFGAPGMLNQAAIFGNIHLRIAMKMQPDVVAGLTEFGPVGKRLIRDIDVAGKFVQNWTGKDDESITGQAANLPPERRKELIAALQVMAGTSMTRPVVFQGDAATDVFENAALQEVKRQRAQLTPKLLEALARKEEGPSHGFGQPRWVAADRPLGLWLGRLFSVHGRTMAALGRAVHQNLLLVAASAEARAGMLTGVLVSAAVLCRPEELMVDILHAGGDDDDPSVHSMTLLTNELLRAAGFETSFSREPNQIDLLLTGLDADLTQRKTNGAKNLPSRLVL